MLLAAKMPAQQETAKRTTIISLQPLPIAFRAYQAEVERVLEPTWTLGVAGSFLGDDDGRERLSGDVKVRYYPMGKAPEGFSIAWSAGLVRVTKDRAGDDFSDSGIAMGMFIDHAWLFVPARRYYAAVGVGAKVLRVDFPPDSCTDYCLPDDRYLTFRFSVGFGF